MVLSIHLSLVINIYNPYMKNHNDYVLLLRVKLGIMYFVLMC